MFLDGDFSTPMFVHEGIPPDTTTMELLKSKIDYKYEEISSGGRVRMRSNAVLRSPAIHGFLRCQISEHQTVIVVADSP